MGSARTIIYTHTHFSFVSYIRTALPSSYFSCDKDCRFCRWKCYATVTPFNLTPEVDVFRSVQCTVELEEENPTLRKGLCAASTSTTNTNFLLFCGTRLKARSCGRWDLKVATLISLVQATSGDQGQLVQSRRSQ